MRTWAFLGSSGALLLGLGLVHLTQGPAGLGTDVVVAALFAPDDSTAHNVVRHVRLPRAAIGVIAGIALGVAGVLLQTVTRNPLASPSTLGVTAGAYLALVAATVFSPALVGAADLPVAFAGGLFAAVLVYAIAAGAGASPVRLALAGVAVSLALAAATAALQILYEQQIGGLFFWGAGSLAQQDWREPVEAAPRLLVGILLALALARMLDVLLLGDDVARGLGLHAGRVRFGAAMLAVFLAATAVTAVGPISFVGLVAPHLVRLMGFTSHGVLLAGAALWGAIVLVGADVLARLVTGITEFPTGGVTALVGAPFLVWLARRGARADAGGVSGGARTAGRVRRPAPYPRLLVLATLATGMTFLLGVALGDRVVGPISAIATLLGQGTALSERIVLDLRVPRLLVAALAGAALSVSGLLLQGVVRNPLAGPEIVGVTAGAGLAAVALLVAMPTAPMLAVQGAAFAGAFTAIAIVLRAAWRGGLAPARLALVGMGVAAFCAAGINLLVVHAKLAVGSALVWLAGSTYARGWDEVLRLVGWPLVLLPAAYGLARWLDLLALGDDVAGGLGLPVERARVAIIAVAVALAASAVAIVGTIGFVGLIGPHAARLLAGTAHRRLVPIAALFGAALVLAADTLGRTVIAPREIPAGLVTALVGTPYFVWLLWRSRALAGTAA